MHMNVETRAEAAQFPEKEYINGIAVAEHSSPPPPLAYKQTLVHHNPSRCNFNLMTA